MYGGNRFVWGLAVSGMATGVMVDLDVMMRLNIVFEAGRRGR